MCTILFEIRLGAVIYCDGFAAPSTPFIGWFSCRQNRPKVTMASFTLTKTLNERLAPSTIASSKKKRKSGKLTESSLVRYSSSGDFTPLAKCLHIRLKKGRRNRVHEIRNRGDALCKA